MQFYKIEFISIKSFSKLSLSSTFLSHFLKLNRFELLMEFYSFFEKIFEKIK
ncbi:hypothetical protein RIEPE_0049 [Candidatus Riesia pediculicola USDA]|uniref:Uncharacterized protein n=1 Tax=Riesia pediculicola (strain USDA) TaxID=515618 RepID=D4G7L6_RIEPU|nr:hypothetical protein RIEPE_0049 [Candidatus Riesia pediculicola USDA]